MNLDKIIIEDIFLKEQLLLKKNKVFLPSQKDNDNISKEMFLVFKSDLLQLGYTVDSLLEKELYKLNQHVFISLYFFIISTLKDSLGDNVSYKPLLQEFIKSNCSNSFILPTFEYKNPKYLTVGTNSDLEHLFANLVSSKTNISEFDKDFISLFIISYRERALKFIPDNIPLKENISLISKNLFSFLDEENINLFLKKHISTATDLLRLITSLSDGDVSLKQPVKFKLNNKERRIVSSLLNSLHNPEEDMKRYINRWKKIGEILHIGKNKSKYPNAFKAFDLIRNNPTDIKSFNSKLKIILNDLSIIKVNQKKFNHSLIDLLRLLSLRPGEFARNIDLILRNTKTEDHSLIISSFEKVIKQVSTTVLLQLKGNLKSRNKKELFRYFSPKGNISKLTFIETGRKVINIKSLNLLSSIIDNCLLEHYALREKKYKNVYINKELLSNVVIPTSLRSSSKSNILLTRGSRIKINSDKYIRMFLWWMNSINNNYEERVDIDLSAIAFDEDWNYVSHLDYTKLNGIGGEHSGDFTDAPRPQGASEFIDINKELFLEQGIRYISMNVYSFTGQKFKNVDCFAGVMEISSLNQTDVYNPLDVSIKYSLTGDNCISIPLFFDLLTSEIIWSDLGLSSEGKYHSVSGNKNNISLMGKSINSFLETKVNLFELAMLNLSEVENIDFIKDENKTYDLELDKDFISNLDEIIANWL
jgi:hypothetical protein